MRLLRTGLTITAVMLLAIVLATGTVRAECQVTDSSGNDDTVLCSTPDDPDGINTGDGNDTITVESGVQVSHSENTINTEQGNDTVYNYGTVRSALDPVDVASGDDAIHNYGLLEGGDNGVGCAPQANQVCSIYNYSAGTIRAAMKAVDYRAESGALGYIYNEGLIESLQREALHLHLGSWYQLMNQGTISAETSAVEVFGASIKITNFGLIHAAGNTEPGRENPEYAINLDSGSDVVINYGTITSDNSPAVAAADGNDVIENHGAIVSGAYGADDAAIETDNGQDVIISSGEIRMVGAGYAAIEAGRGSDKVIIRGGLIQGLINGEDASGGQSSDIDILIFELTGSQAEVDAFRNVVSLQSASSGSATWQGNTYTWSGFERIVLNMTVADLGSAQPQPQGLACPSSAAPGSGGNFSTNPISVCENMAGKRCPRSYLQVRRASC